MNAVKRLFSRLGLDWFLPAIVLSVVLAWLLPGPGLAQEPVSLASIANSGVTVIFFFYGLKLNKEKLKAGLANWPMHILIQGATFLLFPLLALVVKPFFSTEKAQAIWLGIFFLCSLPSTVSSSVVMVSIAGGNIPGAIFNASISALIGVAVTPLWIGIFLQNATGTVDAGEIVLKLLLQVLVPVIAGLLLNKRFGSFAEKHRTGLKTFDQLVILLIIYTSFCKSFAEKLFSGLHVYELLLLAAGMLGLFLAAMFLMKLIAQLLHFNQGDTITVMFCGSKKSLVHGTVMAGIIFAGNPLTGILLLPLMLYHALQLIAASILAQKMAPAHN